MENSNLKKKTLITNISELSSHDGPGMRTTIFFHGCSLHCKWCQNPETIYNWNTEELSEKKTSSAIENKKHLFAERYYTVKELVNKIHHSAPLLQALGGGITFSGGEPTLQSEFILSLIKELRVDKLHFALDTCGQNGFSSYSKLLPYIDLILFDLKEMDSKKHKKFTGHNNSVILENFKSILDYIINNNLKTKIWIRTPLIPYYTATEANIVSTANLIKTSLEQNPKRKEIIQRWELCAFNNLCADKYHKLGIKWELENKELLTKQDLIYYKDLATKIIGKNILIKTVGLTKKI